MIWTLIWWLSVVGLPMEPTFQFVILDIDPSPLTGPALYALFQSWHLYGRYFTTLDSLDVAMDSRSLWITAGMFPDNGQIPVYAGHEIEEYLQTVPNARFFLEGGDVFAFDPEIGYWDPKPWMGILLAEDSGFGEEIVIGTDNALIPWEGDTGVYSGGMYSWVDQFSPDPDPPHGGTAQVVLMEPERTGHWDMNRGIAYNQGSWKTMAFTMESGGLTGTINPAAFARAILFFFDIPIAVSEDSLASPAFRPPTLWPSSGTLPLSRLGPGVRSLALYDVSGRRLWTHHVVPPMSPDVIQLPALRTGLYFLILQANSSVYRLPVIFLASR